jgi:hypothetical protein
MGCLLFVEVLRDGGQEVLAMVTHLLFGHRRIRRHERSGERTELADDLGMASLNEALSDWGWSAAGMSTSGSNRAIRAP